MIDADKPERTAVNDSGSASDTPATLEQTRRDLIVMREAHAPEEPAASRASHYS